MSIHTPFRDWRINSVFSIGIGWNVFSAGGGVYSLEAQDDIHIVPPIAAGEIVPYDIPAPTNTRPVRRQGVPESPSSEAVYHQPRLQGLSLPRLIRRFSVNCISAGIGLDITDMLGIPSASISLPFFPSTGPERVYLERYSQASATDLTGLACILEIGGAFIGGISLQALFLGTTPIPGMSTSDGADLEYDDLERRLRGESISTFESLIAFFNTVLVPHGFALIGGTSVGVGELGISIHAAILRASAVGSTVVTVDARDI